MRPAYGGSALAESDGPGKGARFKLIMPTAMAAPAPVKPVVQATVA